jgi:periplasmic protein CpxP/Spy
MRGGHREITPINGDRQSQETTMTTETTNVSARRRSRRWTWFLALPLAGALAVPAMNAFARPGRGPDAGEHGPFGGDGRHMGKLLDAAGATDAQRAQIKATWDGLRPQLQALRQDRMKLHGEMKTALTAATVDTAAVERLRQEGVKLADRSSTLITQGIVQTAQVLSPEQRQKIAAQLDKHGPHSRGQ